MVDQLQVGPVMALTVDGLPQVSAAVQAAPAPAVASAPVPERAIETDPGAAPQPAVAGVPTAGIGPGSGGSLGLSQLLASVLAVSSAFAAWRSRVS
jgi:hypothetical protein